MTRKFVVWNSVQCQYGSGSWAVIDGTLVVITALGRKTAKLEGFPPEVFGLSASFAPKTTRSRILPNRVF
jgi:hypothetical protein